MATNRLRQLPGTRCCLGAPALRPLQEQIEQANASGRTPVVFIHGLWLLASSWDRWAEHFAQAGYAPVSPGWPDDPDTVEEATQTACRWRWFAGLQGSIRELECVLRHLWRGYG